MSGQRRPWKVLHGYSGRYGLEWGRTDGGAGMGIPTRSFATEERAREYAVAAISDGLGQIGQHFAAVRLYCSGSDTWPVGQVDEYTYGETGYERKDLLEQARQRLAEYEEARS